MTATATVAGVTRLGAAEIARRVRAGDLSAREVVEAHIRRIEAVNPRLNAVVWPMFDEARAAADAADAARARGAPLGPLHGVPITVKDQFFVAGTPTTFGLPSRGDHRAAADAPTVARLRDAGAIILGKGNVPQLLMYLEADNFLFGRTNNPWNLERTPSGGTGGDAALIAAGGSTLALAADFTGSIRVPAHVCGLAGLKPTSGRLTNLGSPPELFFPGQEGLTMQPGVLARTVEDVALSMGVLAAPGLERLDVGVPPVPWPEPTAVAVPGLRVGFYEDDRFFPASPALRRAVREAADALRERGASVMPFAPPDVGRMMRLTFALLGADGGAWVRRALGRNKRDRRVRMLLLLAGLPGPVQRALPSVLGPARQDRMAEALRGLGTLSAGQYWRVLEARNRYKAAFMTAMDQQHLDVLICPPYALPAPRHGDTLYLFTAASYAILFNLMGMPAGVVPATRVRPGEESDRRTSLDIVTRTARAAERSSAGLPIGVQVAARHWREDVALAVMAALEEHFRTRTDFPAYPPI
jgi:fatty acid amide hydrolase